VGENHSRGSDKCKLQFLNGYQFFYNRMLEVSCEVNYQSLEMLDSKKLIK